MAGAGAKRPREPGGGGGGGAPAGAPARPAAPRAPRAPAEAPLVEEGPGARAVAPSAGSAWQAGRCAALGGAGGSVAVAVAAGPRGLWAFAPAGGVGALEGKNGVYLARPGAPALPARELGPLCHESEVQALAAAPGTEPGSVQVASADAKGRCTVMEVREGWQAAALAGPGELGPAQVYSVSPQAYGESGWTGVALSSENARLVAAARFFARDITMYDGGFPIGEFHTAERPRALRFLPAGLLGNSPALLAVAEGNKLSLWDARVERGCVSRHSSPDQVGVVASGAPCAGFSGGVIATAGEERAVNLWDPRRMGQIFSRYSPDAIRNPITFLEFSSRDSSSCFVGTQGGELLHGAWVPSRKGGPTLDKTQKAAAKAAAEGTCIRGGGRWAGMCKLPGHDHLVGLTERGSLITFVP